MKTIIRKFIIAEFDVMGYCRHNFSPDILVTHVDDLDDDSKVFVPRLNKAQVLTDYAPILVEGFVWEALCIDLFAGGKTLVTKNSGALKYELLYGRYVSWIAFKAVEKGSEYEEWAIANDVPIYNKDMELVK